MSSLFDSGIRPIIDQHLLDKAAEKRNYGDYWSASSAGFCMRKLLFERLGVPPSTPPDARKQRVFTSGHIFHNWIQELTKRAGISVAQELELQDEGLMVRGHFDDLILIDGKLILYDYKTVNSRAFTWAKKNGGAMSYFHRMQLGTYLYMMRKLNILLADLAVYGLVEEGRILKISKDDLRMEEQQLLYDANLENEVVKFWTELQGHWEAKTLPPCTCADQEGAFMAKEKFNPYYYNGEPCSLDWYLKWKKETKDAKHKED